MEGETSPFESSEMLASFLASTPLLSESWKLCSQANAAAPQSFVWNRIGDVSYMAFSGVQTVAGLDLGCRSLVAVDNVAAGVFPALQGYGCEAEEPVMVHAGMLRLFLSMINLTNFQTQVFDIMKESKMVVFTGHSLGGTMASLSALWLLSHPQSTTTTTATTTVLCITFGTPLLGNVSLSQAILQERWGGNFCHVVGKHDIVPRLLLAPLSPLSTPHLHSLLRYWHVSMNSPYFRLLTLELSDEEKNSLFIFTLSSVEALAKSGESSLGRDYSFCPFGNYVFCTNEGAICLDNAVAVVKMLHLMFATGCATSCIEDHLKYEAYVGQVSLEFLKSRGFAQGDQFPESSYEVGVKLALHSSEIDCRDPVWEPAKDCLKTAKRMGQAPNIKSANLARDLSKFTPLRAQIEWYKESCDDRMGYYDSFKLRGASKKDAKVNMNRIKLARFWDDLIQMLDTNQLPHDFHWRSKWVNASQFYKLLVEPLDIAEYYQTGMHRVKGHYVKHGRERRYKVFDTWWSNRKVVEEENNQRNRYASLTQDSCFWASVEEAREWIENVRSESDSRKLTLIWENIHKFEQFAISLVQRKEVSKDVLAENSSYSLWMKELRELKSQL